MPERSRGSSSSGKRWSKWDRATPEERFWSKVDKTSDPGGCWLWTGSISDKGYGLFSGPGRRTVLAHRFGYQLQVGPIPAGHTLDHVRERGCRFRHCVRDIHLEPVTMKVNLMRGDTPAAANAAKTHCLRGHEFAGANLRIDKRGGRVCRQCRRESAAERYRASKQ